MTLLIAPRGHEGGPMFIREGIRSIEDLNLPDDVKQKIYIENARKLLKFDGHQHARG